MPAEFGDRDTWLRQEDKALLAACDVDTYRASGPGGQKRNKTSSAVRLRHGPSGLMVIAEESRSQHENKAKALRRLRRALALSVRIELSAGWSPPDELAAARDPSGTLRMSSRNPAYPLVTAAVLDALASCGGRMSDAAGRLGLSTGQLSRFMASDGKLLTAANRIRLASGLKALRQE